MKNFLKDIFVFLLLGIILGEVIARSFSLTSDIPNRFIDDNGIQKYIPNQIGSWKGGSHQWHINDKGWPGDLPKSFDNLITIIGDSYIENFMNPDECRQSSYLRNLLPEYNFLEASRSGVSFIEAMEISKHLDTLNPRIQLIHVYDSDFLESIVQIKKHGDITQIDLNEKKILHGKMQASGLKNILYNWKFIYYLYRRFPFNIGNEPETPKTKGFSEINTKRVDNLFAYKELLEYVIDNYHIENTVLVFRPESDIDLVNLTRKIGFRTLHLKKSEHENWSFDHDSHWNCSGHEKVALQVAILLNKMMN